MMYMTDHLMVKTIERQFALTINYFIPSVTL